jgi:hypothetical protein
MKMMEMLLIQINQRIVILKIRKMINQNKKLMRKINQKIKNEIITKNLKLNF